MNALRLSFVTAALLAVCSVAQAAGNQKKVCVDASTQGQTERDAGHLLEARTQFLQCASDECPAIVRKSCGQWLADVEERIPSVVVRVLDASGQDLTDAQLTIDGQAVELDGRAVQLDPGPHTLVVTHASGTVDRKTLLAEKEKGRIISVQLGEPEAPAGSDVTGGGGLASDAPPPAPEDSAKIPVGVWVLGGVGIAGLGAFTYFGLTAKGEYDELKNECSPGCTDDETSAGRTNALLADISLGVGVAALVGGVTWLIIAKKKKPESNTAFGIAPARAGASFSFSARY